LAPIVLRVGHLAQRPGRGDPRVRVRVGVPGDPFEDLDHLIAAKGLVGQRFSVRFSL
jgi:hypothetical protein